MAKKKKEDERNSALQNKPPAHAKEPQTTASSSLKATTFDIIQYIDNRIHYNMNYVYYIHIDPGKERIIRHQL